MRRYKKNVVTSIPVEPEKWQPCEQKIQTVESRIKYQFDNNVKSDLIDPKPLGVKKPENLDDNLIQAYARIGAFLMDKQAVFNHLKELDKLLENQRDSSSGELPVSALRELLENELKKLGFHPHFGKTLANVRPEVFRAAIAHGMLLKDAVIGDTLHGEFTHLIQWLAIAWQQEASHFLDKPVIEIFKQLGLESSVYYRDPVSATEDPNSRREEKSIWDLIVDSMGDNDFRSPEVLNSFILQSNELPTLRELLQKRTEKRSQYKFEEKYKEVQSLSFPRLFFRKNNKIPYVGGNLEDVLEPEDSTINFTKFMTKA